MEHYHYLFHFKHFDLAYPLLHLPVQLEICGLITSDSMVTEAERGKSFLGIPRVSELRMRFYRSCLTTLKNQYRDLNIPFIETEKTLPDFISSRHGEQDSITIWLPHLSGSEEHADIADLHRKLPHNCAFQSLPANTLVQERELPFSINNLPNTFSQFRKRIEKKKYSHYSFARTPLESLPATTPGRKRRDAYIFKDQHILTYKATRNGLGEGDYSSRFSKWLATHSISAAEVGAAILQFEQSVKKNSSTYWLMFELLWRDYFYFLHKKIGDKLFFPGGLKNMRSPGLMDSIPWVFHDSNEMISYPAEYEAELIQLWNTFRKWTLGQTGNDFIDAMMLEIFNTGELSNRGRQCAASYLIHDLHVPWWWGAQWFEYLLLDYDVSSNWGNWAYIAGVGADPRPVRKFNIPKQAKIYDADCDYRNWVVSQNWSIPDETLPLLPPAKFI